MSRRGGSRSGRPPSSAAGRRPTGRPTRGLGKLAVLVGQGPGDRLAIASGPHRERPAGAGVRHDGRVPHAIDELPAHARVERRHQPQPEAREGRREHRDRQEQPSESPLSRVLSHEPLVRHDVGAADLEHSAFRGVEVEPGEEVGDQVLDRDRLGLRPHPARRDHDGQPLDEGSDHLERQAPGAEDDRGAELDGRDAGSGQQAADLLAAREVRRQGASRSEPSEVDDPPHARHVGRLAEARRRPPVRLFEPAPDSHRMDEVVGDIAPGESTVERCRVLDVARHDLDPGSRAVLERLGPPDEAPDVVAASLESGQKPAADIAGGAGQ